MKKQIIRILFKHKGELFQYLNISISKDNSFHFHLYEEANEGFKYFPSTKLKDGRIKIDITNLVNTQFIRNKFTFHPSGILHSSDKYGKRFKDGLKGISFNDIDISNLILLLAPKKISSLKKYSTKKDGFNLAIELEEHQNPFTLNFEVFRKSKRQNLKNIPVKIIQGPHTIEWPNFDLGLRFYTQEIIGKAVWPSSSLVLKRIGK